MVVFFSFPPIGILTVVHTDWAHHFKNDSLIVQSEQALLGLAVLCWAFMTNSDGLVEEPDLPALIFQCVGGLGMSRILSGCPGPKLAYCQAIGRPGALQQICQLSHTQLKSKQ